MNQNLNYSGDEFSALANSPNYYNWILHNYKPYLSGNITEIGAGIGTFSRLLLPYANKLSLVEPSVNLTNELKVAFSSDERIVIYQDTLIEHFDQQSPALQDAIVLVNVLEHIQDDGAALLALADNLASGGALLLFVPALPFLFSKMDENFGHYRRYTLPGLVEIVEQSGLKVEQKSYFDLLGILPWWLLNTVGGSVELNPQMVGIYDRFGIPLTRTMEKFISPPFGKNISLIATKP
jgi:SAM-dependent methyltransferase